MSPKRTAAIIGCGKVTQGKEGWAIGHGHAMGYREVDPGITLLGVDVNPENLAAFGSTFGVAPEHLFHSTADLYHTLTPDYTSICTWPGLHAPLTIEAAAHGVRGIYCEKPLALNPDEIRFMRAACEQSGARLAVAHQRRLEPVFMRAKEIINSGELGGHLTIEGRIGESWDILSWTTHLFDLANYYFEAVPDFVLAGLDHIDTRRYGQAVEDASVIFLEYPGRRQAIFITGPEAPGDYLIQARGTGGMLTMHGPFLRIFTEAGFRQEEIHAKESFMAPVIRELIDGVEKGTPMTCDVASCSIATEIAYAAHESARTMRKIQLPVNFEYAPLEIAQASPNAWLPDGEIVLYADEHFDSGGREGIAEALREATGRNPLIIDAAKEPLSTAQLASAGLVLIYHTQATADAETRSALTAWVGAGKPLAILHAGLGAYPDWDAYTKWCGRVWAWNDAPVPSEHPHEAGTLHVTGNLPLAWDKAQLPQDEVFIKLAETSECENLVSVSITAGTHPAAWTNAHHSNIGVWVLGHRRDLWNVPAMRGGFIALLQKISQCTP